MSDDPAFQNFVGLSALLTGYLPSQLAPAIDPVGLALDYFGTMQRKADSQSFLQTLSTFQNIAENFPPEEQAAEVEQQILNDEAMGNIARRILRLWFLSTWYTDEPPGFDGEVVSMDAYTLGKAWDTFQAHPMGYSELAFGYWAAPPPAASPVITPESPAVINTGPTEETATQLGGRQRGGV